MSEQKTNYMAELDRWTETTIIEPLADCGDEQLYEELVEQVKKAIRTKVLESYHNGKEAGGAKPAFKPRKEFRR